MKIRPKGKRGSQLPRAEDPDLNTLGFLLSRGLLVQARVIAARFTLEPTPSEERRVAIGEVLLAQGFFDEAAPWFTPKRTAGGGTDGALEIRRLAGRCQVLIGQGKSPWRVARCLAKRCVDWSARSPDRRWWSLCLLLRMPYPNGDDHQVSNPIFETHRRLKRSLARSMNYRRAFWDDVPGRTWMGARSFIIEYQMQELVAAIGPCHLSLGDFLDRKDYWDPPRTVDWRQRPKQDEMRWALHRIAAQELGIDSVITARLALAVSWIALDEEGAVQHADQIVSAAQVLEANLRPGHPEVIAGWRLAATAVGHASPANVRAIHERLLDIADRCHGRPSLIVAHGLQLLADHVVMEGDHERALECRREALAMLLDPAVLPEFALELVSQDPVVGERVGGYVHRLAEQIANQLLKSGRPVEAIPLVQRVVAYVEWEYPSSPVPAWTMALLAGVEQQAGHHDAALLTYGRTWRLLAKHASNGDSGFGSPLDWDECDDSSRRGPELVRRVAAAYGASLRDLGRIAEADALTGDGERLAKCYAPRRNADVGGA